MKSTKTLLVLLLVLAALLITPSCGSDAPSFASPEGTVKAFIGATQAKDLDLMSQCFSQSRDEFKAFWSKTASDKELEQGKAMFAEASIERVEDGKDGKKIVHVKLPKFTRDEALTMVQEGERWLILDF